jgi:hypothetical protein
MFLSCSATASAGNFQARSAPQLVVPSDEGQSPDLIDSGLRPGYSLELFTATTLLHASTASCQRVNVFLLDTLVVAAFDRDGGAMTLEYLGTEQIR